MKKLTLLAGLLLFATLMFPDSKITRGPNVGEIYFIGTTHTGLGLYHSTDFGQTAVCVDSTFTSSIMSICADKTEGVVYYVTMQEGLYLSDDYGYINTWELRSGGIKAQINSGIQDGYIYSSFSEHSENYGLDFISHNYNGFFGSKLDVEIDNESEVGYTVVDKYNVLDSLFLLISYDNFDVFELRKSFKMSPGYGVRLSRGFENGELYLYNKLEGRLLISQDYGLNLIETNKLNTSLEFYDIVGGRCEKEIYVLLKFVNMLWQNAHTYVLHSYDYGITYEVFHPFAKGQEPLLANFSAKSIENAVGGVDIKTIDSVYYVTGDMPLEVKFYNYSIGEIITYEWDFDNDGIVDSYEENPTFTYNELGWHSVKLTIYDDLDTNSFLRENYIYVDKVNGMRDSKNSAEFSCYPNPFSEKVNFSFTNDNPFENNGIVIYDLNGKIVNQISTLRNQAIWDGKNINGKKCKPGIYIAKLKDQKTSKKILLTK